MAERKVKLERKNKRNYLISLAKKLQVQVCLDNRPVASRFYLFENYILDT